LTLWTSTGQAFWTEVLRDQLRDGLGLTDVDIQTVEFSEYLERVETGEITGPYVLGWLMDYPSPENYLSMLHTDGPSNYAKWSNRQFDQLVDQGNAAPSIEESLSFYAQAQEVAAAAMPHVPLFFEKAAVAHSSRVSNVRIGPTGRLNWAGMSIAPSPPNDLS
jgi:oligopeptide transport system substrate-binding protein